MSHQLGKLLHCDRPGCTAEIFLEYTKTEEMDGGFTKIDHFAKKPEGWTTAHELNCADLCPECSRVYAAMKLRFLEGYNYEN